MSSFLRGPWRWHCVLGALALVQVIVFAVRHTSDDSAWRIVTGAESDADELIWALHLLTNRATEADARLGDQAVRRLLGSADERLREFALTVDLSKHRTGVPPEQPPPLQNAYVYSAMPDGMTPHRYRSVVLFRRKVGGSRIGGIRRMQLPELRWFLDANAGRPLPTREILEYFQERGREAEAAAGNR